jgi:2-haloacid dehalogenase
LRARRWKLAILSNTDRDFLDASLHAIGVPVDLTVVASEIGSYKPAHGHWRVFFERSAVPRTAHVHVAASLFHDIAPAADLGLTAVWIDRDGETSDLPRAATLPDLATLPDALDALVPG